MNDVVKKFKKGHKIHIKESLKGTFTKWCGGNVTDECILRGKNSSNPKIRKKATFAANARKWKHKEGGIIKANAGTLLALNMGMNFLGLLPSIIGNSKKNNDNNKDSLNTLNLLIVADYLNNYDNIMSKLHDQNNPNAGGGSIVRNYIKYKLLAPMLFQQRLLLNNLKKLLDMLTQLKKTDALINMSSSILLNGLGLLSNYSKSSNNYTFSNPSYWDTYALNLSKSYGSVDSTGTMKLNSGTISLLNGYKPYSQT